MFFDSLIRRKQGVCSPPSPSISPLTTTRQVYFMNPGNKNEMQPKPGNKKIIINRSKSQQQFNKNGLGHHAKHPILEKERHYRQIENINIQQTSMQGPKVYESLSQSRNQGCEKQANTYEGWRSKQKYADYREYDLKNLPRVSHHYKIKQSRDFIETPHPFIALPPNYVPQATGHRPHKSQLQSPQQSNFFVKRKSSQQVQILSPFNIDSQQNDTLEEETTKLSHAQGEKNLSQTVRSLQKQIESIKQERNKDKLNIEILSLENDRLKKSALKSKQNIDVKSKDRFQLLELKKLLREEGDNRQCMEKQRQIALKELNEALIDHEAQKIKWEKQKKQFHQKIQTLLLQVKEKKGENVLLTQKINFIHSENKKLRQTKQNLQKQIHEKEKEVTWVNSKVNDLKEALQLLKAHGNSRIQKLELELKEVEKTRKEQNINEVKNMEKKLRDQCEAIRELSLEIQDLNAEIQSYHAKIQQTDQQLKQQKEQKEQLKKANHQEIKKASAKASEYAYKEKMIKDEIIQLTSKLDESNSITKKLKSEKELLENISKEGNIKINSLVGQISKISRQLRAKQSEIENFESKIIEIQRQSTFEIERLKTKNVSLEAQISVLNSRLQQMAAHPSQAGQKIKQKPSHQMSSKIAYSQLQMRMCSALGIYLTSSIDKIMGPVDEMIKAKKYFQANSKSYEELLRIFEIREGGQDKLVQQMQEYKVNYHRVVSYNYRLQAQNGRLKQENTYLIRKLQQANFYTKKLQPILQNSNETLIKLRLKLQNEKYSATGTKKC